MGFGISPSINDGLTSKMCADRLDFLRFGRGLHGTRTTCCACRAELRRQGETYESRIQYKIVFHVAVLPSTPGQFDDVSPTAA